MSTDLDECVIEMNPIVSGDDAHDAGLEVTLKAVEGMVHFDKILGSEEGHLFYEWAVLAKDAHHLLY